MNPPNLGWFRRASRDLAAGGSLDDLFDVLGAVQIAAWVS